MGHPGAGIAPLISLDRSAATPLQRQIYESFRAAVLRGDLRPGQQLPSSRQFAAEAAVSRFPVLHAYAQLLAEGYFESRAGSGTFVSASLPEQVTPQGRRARSTQKSLSGPRPIARRALLYPEFEGVAQRRGWGAFGVHQPAFEEFPFAVWSRLVARHSRNPQAGALHHVNPLGLERFRQELCAYLRTSRAVQCEPEQIMIVSGSQQAIDITARVLLDPGSRVIVEDPCYNLERVALVAAGCRLVPIPVDAEGMNITGNMHRTRNARAAFVTPSHQYPLGSTMSATRRLHLLNWAQSSGAWIIEDDYDSEFRYESQPVASLQGLDRNARVIYIGTFSKVLFPSLRIGYIVIPSDLVKRFAATRLAMDIFPPYLYQEVLADFMHMGYFARHIRKMRQFYGERRTALIESLHSEFGDMLQLHGAEAGMHLTVTLPAGFDDREIAARAAREKLWLWPLSPYYLGRKPRQGLVLGFGSTVPSQIHGAVRRLRALIQG